MNSTIWRYWVIYFSACAIIMFCNLLPLSPASLKIPGPDLILAITLVWVLRRPDYVPVWLVASVFLLADFLLMRPLGLMTLIALLITEFLRRNVQQREILSFYSEILQISLILCIIFIAQRIVLLLMVVPVMPIINDVIHLVITLIFYPVVMIISQVLLDVRRLLPGEVDSLGGRV